MRNGWVGDCCHKKTFSETMFLKNFEEGRQLMKLTFPFFIYRN